MMLFSAVRNYLRVRYAFYDRAHTTFEDLKASRRLAFDCEQIAHIDEPAVDAAFRLVHDVTGTFRFEPHYTNKPPPEGRSWLPPLVDLNQEAVIFGKHGWIITQQGWLQPMSFVRGQSFLQASLRNACDTFFFVGKTVRLDGVTFNAMSDFATHVYGHALWESVYRILLYWNLHGSFDALDHILAPRFAQKLLGRFDADILEAARPKLVDVGDKYTKFVCDNVAAAPHPITAASVTRGQAELLNRYASISDRHRGREKIFLGRAGHRRGIANYDEVVETVRRFGYEIVIAGETPDVFSLFRSARSVIGVHGSDLADVIFMEPGAAVLELTPTDHVQGYFREAGSVRDLRYRTLFCRSDRHKMRGDRQSRSSLRVDSAALAKALAED
jgi:hypothetical protein